VSLRQIQFLFVASNILLLSWMVPRAAGFPAVDAPDSAKAVAQRLEEHYRRIQSLRAVFLERYSEGPREARIESGTVYFRRPGRMRWEYEAPEKKLFIADGKFVWFYVPADRTVTRAPAKESSDWRTPLALLTGKADLSRLCGRMDMVSQKGIPAGHIVLRCLPKGEKDAGHAAANTSSEGSPELPGAGDFTEVFLEIDSASGELADVRIRQAGGIELEYRFGDWREGLPLSDEMFRFQAPSGVAIVDGSALSKSAN
jgi:outer membrane lipoprotein carrier protein